MCCFTSADEGADLADFEDVRIFRMFRTSYLRSVPEDIVFVQVGICRDYDAMTDCLFLDVPSNDNVAAGVR